MHSLYSYGLYSHGSNLLAEPSAVGTEPRHRLLALTPSRGSFFYFSRCLGSLRVRTPDGAGERLTSRLCRRIWPRPYPPPRRSPCRRAPSRTDTCRSGRFGFAESKRGYSPALSHARRRRRQLGRRARRFSVPRMLELDDALHRRAGVGVGVAGGGWRVACLGSRVELGAEHVLQLRR